jgi:triosephosphate isomerase
MDVCIAPTDIHISTFISAIGDHKINPMAQDVSQYGRGAYTGNITAD